MEWVIRLLCRTKYGDNHSWTLLILSTKQSRVILSDSQINKINKDNTQDVSKKQFQMSNFTVSKTCYCYSRCLNYYTSIIRTVNYQVFHEAKLP